MGETRVDLHHLLEDLRDAYAGPIEETILTEVIANALDSGARRIQLTAQPARGTLTVLDDGSGMTRRDLRRYHDLATSTKARGQGIGFAGVGIKLGLLVCSEVVTETRRGKTHVASAWALASRRRAPWRWIEPPGLVPARGTAVCLTLDNPLSPLLDAGYIEQTIKRHFTPLLEPDFKDLLAPYYGEGVTFEVGGAPFEHTPIARGSVSAPLVVRIARQRKPSGVGYLVRVGDPLPEEHQGLAISTFGKVIRRGWDWVGVTPSDPQRVGGLMEVPALSACLTLNKADFIRSGARGATFLAYRRAIQEAVTRQLAEWGEDANRAPVRQKMLRDRDIETALEDLADDFPLLGTLVERRRGGQRVLPMTTMGAAPNLVAPTAAGSPSGDVEPEPERNGESAEAPEPAPPASDQPRHEPHPSPVDLPQATQQRRRSRYGLEIRFESRPDDPELGRLLESTVWVNEAHPAYGRAVISRSTGYHIALAVGLALAPLTRESHSEHEFLTRFLARWGETLTKPRGRGRQRR